MPDNYNIIDHRIITKFDKHNIPYCYAMKEIPDTETIRKVLLDRMEESETQPVIVCGDISGLKDFNNHYGREAADTAIEKALTVFVQDFAGIAGSPSGDEMWAVPPKESNAADIINNLTEILKKFNNINLQTDKGNVGLNARFYVGRKHFTDVEKNLKYHSHTGEKLPPGTIVIDGSLLGKEKDIVLQPQEVSNENIVGRTGRQSHSQALREKEKIRGGGLQGRNGAPKKESAVSEKERTGAEQDREEKLRAVKKPIQDKKNKYGFIADKDPLITDLKTLQGRDETKTKGSRRDSKHTPRDEEWSDKKRKDYICSSKETRKMKKLKLELLEKQFPPDEVKKFVDTFYDSEKYSHLQGKDNRFFIMPSTTQVNTIPIELAKRLQADFGGTIVENYADPTHLLEAKSKKFIDKIKEPSKYIVSNISGDYSKTNNILVDDVMSTGQSANALKKELKKDNVFINSTVVLGAVETRTVNKTDIKRFSNKLADQLGIEAADIKQETEKAFEGHNKQFLNYAELNLSKKENEAEEIYGYIKREGKAVSRDKTDTFTL